MEYKSGDHCLIEQQRYAGPNEMYLHKVIGTLKSNFYVDVPVETPRIETIHNGVVDVVNCVCCEIDERHAFRYRLCDVEIQPNPDTILTGNSYPAMFGVQS